MPHADISIVIRAPAEEIYRYLSDITRITEWCGTVASARWSPGSVPGLGARADLVFRIAGQEIPTQAIVLTATPPRELVMRGIIGVQLTFKWKLEPHPEGTRVTCRIDSALPPSVLGREVESLYFGNARTRMVTEDLERLKGAIERQRAS